MYEIITLFSIGIALSMDTFSLSLGIGTFNISSKKALLLSIIVGIMHFLMPLIGVILGNIIINIFKINSNVLLGLILIAISIEMLFDILKKEQKSCKLSFIGILLFAIGVSIDSFSTGLGLLAITSNIYIASFIFSVCSFCFTYLGVVIGKYTTKLLGTYSTLVGAISLIIIGIIYILN